MNERLSGFCANCGGAKCIAWPRLTPLRGWIIIQIAATTFPALQLPLWGIRFVIVAVLLGFPLALVLAWAFDLGPHGFGKNAPPPPLVDCAPALVPPRRNVVVLASIGVLLAAIAGYFVLPRWRTATPEKSIAVLPFENLSVQKENEFWPMAFRTICSRAWPRSAT